MKKFIFLGIILVLIDQISKLLMIDKSIEILSFFSLNYIKNTGALFGLFKGNNFLFIVFGIIVLFLLIRWFLRDKNKFTSYTLVFLISGVIGNLIDRIFHSAVIDFINFKFWYVFNFADCYIVFGLIGLVYLQIKTDRFKY
ncbi:MAG: signal peptidase II [Candidatus Nanoarchaeia archaeon]|nr:signal peptidase II [Candidatus Nanoarchaeia archaeon]